MSNSCTILLVLLVGFCFISWKHSLIGVSDALKLAGRGLIFLGLCTWMIYIIPRMKFFFFPVSQELPEIPPPDPYKQNQENARRIQQDQHNDKASGYAERVLKPRQEASLQQKIERCYRMTGETWKLSPGFAVGGEGEEIFEDVNADESPNQGAKRRRNLKQTLNQLPTKQEVPKQKKVIVLPDEPTEDTEGAVQIALRCPGRRTIHRRFLKSWSSQFLCDWMLKAGFHPAIYSLYSSFPRTEVLTAADVSLEEAGIHTNTLLNVEEREAHKA
ncbi:hypothetical protein DNTS_005307 [Danionella cerebrum]|uniref:UBX domain-containing protein n=1 Tax=Danionella cerebrum TaxID=2873325 RepID=A0A553QI02_9TELE|nr:hypothetical protein DNTS_005307 [Danionella translucida]